MTPRRRGSRVSIRQVAARFGVTYNAAHYHLRRAGVTFRPATGARGWRAEATA